MNCSQCADPANFWCSCNQIFCNTHKDQHIQEGHTLENLVIISPSELTEIDLRIKEYKEIKSSIVKESNDIIKCLNTNAKNKNQNIYDEFNKYLRIKSLGCMPNSLRAELKKRSQADSNIKDLQYIKEFIIKFLNRSLNNQRTRFSLKKILVFILVMLFTILLGISLSQKSSDDSEIVSIVIKNDSTTSFTMSCDAYDLREEVNRTENFEEVPENYSEDKIYYDQSFDELGGKNESENFEDEPENYAEEIKKVNIMTVDKKIEYLSSLSINLFEEMRLDKNQVEIPQILFSYDNERCFVCNFYVGKGKSGICI